MGFSERVDVIRNGTPRAAFRVLRMAVIICSVLFVCGQLKCCFTSTETVGLLGTGLWPVLRLPYLNVRRSCVNRRFPEITGKDNLTVFSYSGRVKSPQWRRQLRRADLRQFQIFRHGPIIIYTRLPAGGT